MCAIEQPQFHGFERPHIGDELDPVAIERRPRAANLPLLASVHGEALLRTREGERWHAIDARAVRDPATVGEGVGVVPP